MSVRRDTRLLLLAARCRCVARCRCCSSLIAAFVIGLIPECSTGHTCRTLVSKASDNDNDDASSHSGDEAGSNDDNELELGTSKVIYYCVSTDDNIDPLADLQDERPQSELNKGKGIRYIVNIGTRPDDDSTAAKLKKAGKTSEKRKNGKKDVLRIEKSFTIFVHEKESMSGWLKIIFVKAKRPDLLRHCFPDPKTLTYPDEYFSITYTIACSKDQNITIDCRDDFKQMVCEAELKGKPEVAITMALAKTVCFTSHSRARDHLTIINSQKGDNGSDEDRESGDGNGDGSEDDDDDDEENKKGKKKKKKKLV